jgi:hypothetical protein
MGSNQSSSSVKECDAWSADAGEATEVAVVGDEGGVVLEGECGQMGVAHQVPARSHLGQEPGHHGEVTGGGFHHDAARLGDLLPDPL